jgi:signal transduction histidine kinase
MERGVNRVFAHGMLAALVVVAFTGAIAGVTTLIYQGGVGVALIAAALVVLTALPLRAYVSQRTDAILFGELDEPYHVITGLGRHLETTAPPDEVLPGVVDTVADALRLPYVAIELESATGTVLAASTGNLDGPATRLPLTYQGERVGWLVLGTRAPGEHLTVADRKLLEDLARQIGVAARAVQLMHDLRRSHTLLVAAREEERKRLRRDLHDGLGPMLAGIDLASQAARNLLRRDPYAADAVLARVVTESRAATAEVRRLVDNLRPLALDRLGLVDALREQILSISAGEGTPDDGLVVVIEASPDLRSLPPAVETAAYRIALEAFVNVRRHANARSCTIRLTRGASLHLAVIDDGDGFFAGACPGVGIASMQERAAELGGTCTVARGEQGGTEVHALLPAALTVSALPTL